MVKRLQNTFAHIPGIGRGTECKLWNCDVLNWEEFLSNHESVDLSESKKKLVYNHINNSVSAYKNKDYGYFLDNLSDRLHWRVYKELIDECCFLDIETTGLDQKRHDITVIGLYDGTDSKFFVNGQNLKEFANEIQKYSTIVTYNGKCFDVPFIQAKFNDIDFNKFHIDLRYVMKEIGYSGGLKRIEKDIGIERSDDLEEVDGYEAVRLWHKYKSGDKEALKLLIKYNRADIENLKVMMDFAYDKLKEKHFLNAI